MNIDSSFVVVSANVECCWAHKSIAAQRIQSDKLGQQGAQVFILQELVSSELDICAKALDAPHTAFKSMRYLAHEKYDTLQGLGVLSNYPIGDDYGKDLGYLHEGGQEHELDLNALGRQVRATAKAAVVESPHGKFVAVSAHGAWTPKAHEGIIHPHQREALEKLSEFLNALRELNLPIILGADFNARVGDVQSYLPEWLELVTPTEGCSLDPSHPAYERAAASNVYIDGVFTWGMSVHGVEAFSGFSDHIGHRLVVSL